ncbi:MAG: CHAT domain-containing protein [Holophagales bacterium]|nr:CHAT domain-containing protein [Holophagales bacterium]
MRARAAILLLALGAEPAIAGAAGSVLVQQSLEGQPLHGEERRVFEIPLTAGEYVEATIREGGVELVGRVLAPEGREILEAYGQYADAGVETVRWIAERTGRHLLEIRAEEPSTAAGTFDLSIVRRQAAAGDPQRVEAGRLLEEGGHDYDRGSAESLARAEALFRQAENLYRGLGEAVGEGEARFRIALVAQELGEHPRAVQLLEAARGAFRAAGEHELEIKVMVRLAWSQVSTGDLEAARATVDESLERTPATPPTLRRGEILNNLGVLHLYQSHYQRALDAFEDAARIWRAIGDTVHQAEALYNVATLYDRLGDHAVALEKLRQALTLFRAAGFRYGEASALSWLGQTLLRLDELAEGHDALVAALALHREIGDRRGEALDLHNLGIYFLRSGAPAWAEAHLEQSLALYEELGDSHSVGVCLDQLGRIHLDAGNLIEAGTRYRRALGLWRGLGGRRGEVESLYGLGRVELAHGRFETASALLERAADLAETLRADPADLTLRMAFFASIQSIFEQWVEAQMAIHRQHPDRGLDSAAFETAERARARGLLDLMTEAAIDIRSVADPALLAREDELLTRLGEAQVTYLLEPQRPPTALPELATLRRQLREVRAQIRATSPAAALADPRPLAVETIRASHLEPGTALLQLALGPARGYLWVLTVDGLASFELPDRTTIERLARQLHELWAAGPRRRTRREAERLAAELGRLLLAPAAAALRGAERWVVSADGALRLIPWGALPAFETATGGRDERWIERVEIVSLPSISALAAQRVALADRPPRPGAIAVVADPVFDRRDPRLGGPAATGEGQVVEAPAGDAARDDRERLRSATENEVLPRLPASAEEAEAILGLAQDRGHAVAALGFEASKERILGGEFADYRILHFATHGVIDEHDPRLSGLVFSLYDRQGRPQAGFLTLDDLYRAELPAELVVSSACRSALGAPVRGEGWEGLARGFHYAGARTVLMSLWEVEDAATRILMEHFYRALWLGDQRPAAALRQAQTAMARDSRWRDPYWWAGFVLQGEWR